METSLEQTKTFNLLDLNKTVFKGKLNYIQTLNFYRKIFRVRRDVLEGTWEEMVDYIDEEEHRSNSTVKRQADFPDIDTTDNSRYY